MNSQYIKTKQLFRLDYKVWLTMIVCIVVSAALAAYRIVNDEPCTTSVISARSIYNTAGFFYTHESIRFTTNGKSNGLKWIFGDGTVEERSSAITSHAFAKEGKYVVSVETNAGCRATIVIPVIKRVEQLTTPLISNNGIVIAGERQVPVNKPATFISSITAENYEWTVLNRNDYPQQHGKTASFIFRLPATYTLQLQLNNDKKSIYQTSIYAYSSLPADRKPDPLPLRRLIPPVIHSDVVEQNSDEPSKPKVQETAPEVPPTKTTIEIPDSYLRKSLEGVMNGSKQLREFEPFLCDGGETHVLLNESSSFISFEELCKTIKNKKYRIDEVTALRDNERGRCIVNISVTVKKKNFLGKWVNL